MDAVIARVIADSRSADLSHVLEAFDRCQGDA